jgi:hypothetical protein
MTAFLPDRDRGGSIDRDGLWLKELLRMIVMVMSRRSLLAAVVLSWLSSTAAADANSLTDYFGPREISLGETMRADSYGSLATTLNPAGLALNRQLVFEGSYGYRPGDSASAVGVSACDSTVVVPGCFYYHYLGAEPTLEGNDYDRRVHEGGIAAAKALSSRLFLGINARYFDYESNLMGESDSSGFAADVGLLLKATSSIQAAVVGYNLLAAESAQYPMGVGAGVTVRPVAALALGLDGLWNLDVPEGKSTGRYGAGMEYFLMASDQQSGYPVRLGVVHDRELKGTYATAGLGYTSLKVGLDVGARKQVDGGDELMVLAALRVFGPHFP